MISFPFQSKLFSIIVIQIYTPTINAEETEVEWFYEGPQYLQELTSKNHKGLECKSRKSRDTWSNRPVWPWSTKWSREKANRVLPRKHTGHTKHPLPTTQGMTLQMDITRWSILKSYWLYSLQPEMKKLFTASGKKKRLEADCGSDYELLLPNSDLNWRK